MSQRSFGLWLRATLTSMAIALLAPNIASAANMPPVASAGGPYIVIFEEDLRLDGTGSNDPEGDALDFSWDIDLDGEFIDAFGYNPTVLWEDLNLLVGPLSPSSNFTIALMVVDPSGAAGTAQTTVNVVSGQTPIPEPTTMILVGSGLVGLAGYGRKRKK